MAQAPADDPAAIAALPAPEGVQPAVWRELTSALAQQVAARPGSAAAAQQLPRPAELTYDPATREITWAYELAGDYDQDGVVTLADLVPLAQHFGEAAPNPYHDVQPGFDYWSIQAVVDGDRNGQIGLSDLTVLGKNLGARVDSYSLYASRSFSDYPLAEIPMTLPTDVIWTADFEYDRSYMTPPGASPAHSGPWVSEWAAELSHFTPAQRRAGRLRFRQPLPNYDPAWEALWIRAEAGNLSGGPSLPAMHPLPDNPFGPPEDYGISYDVISKRLTWYHTLRGDADSNMTINIPDLGALARFIGHHGPWQVGELEYELDADRDNLITIRDARAIGQFYSIGIQGYLVRGSNDPAQAGLVDGGDALGSVELYDEELTSPGRRRYSFDLTGFDEKFVWVVPLQWSGTTAYFAPVSSPVVTLP